MPLADIPLPKLTTSGLHPVTSKLLLIIAILSYAYPLHLGKGKLQSQTWQMVCHELSPSSPYEHIQLTWLRIVHYGEWCLHLALHMHSDASQIWMNDRGMARQCHVQKTVASCFAVLRQLRSIRRSVPTSVYQTLVVALVLSRLDYGNAMLVGLPGYLYSRLQSVLNAAAHSITGLRCSDHITDTLASFHWLKAPEHIQYKLATLKNL